MPIINDSITVHKVKGEDRREALFTFRDETGPVCTLRSSIPPNLKSAAKVLSWELGSLERYVQINPELLKKVAENPSQNILEWSRTGINFAPNTISVLEEDVNLLSKNRIYMDTEFAFFSDDSPPSLENPVFKEWFNEYFIPKAILLTPELEGATEKEIFEWANVMLQHSKGHMSHNALIIKRDGKYEGHLGTTTPLEGILKAEGVEFQVHQFLATDEAVEARFIEFQKALKRKGAKKDRVYERFGTIYDEFSQAIESLGENISTYSPSIFPALSLIFATHHERQKQNLKAVISTMEMRDWARDIWHKEAPFSFILHYHGYDFEELKKIQTKLQKDNSWADLHNRGPRKSSIKNGDSEFFVKERFADAIIIDPLYIAFNCIPQFKRRNLEAICKQLDITFKKGLPRDFLNYLSLLAELGDTETINLIGQYAIEDTAIMIAVDNKIEPQKQSLQEIANLTGIPLKNLTLRREALTELIDKRFYKRYGRHRIPDIILNPKKKKLKEDGKKLRQLPTEESAGSRHLAYVPWPLFIEDVIVKRVPETKALFEAYRTSLDRGNDSLTFIRYLEPIAENLLIGFLYTEKLNHDYSDLFNYTGVSRDEFRGLHEEFSKDWDQRRKIINQYRVALKEIVLLAEEGVEELLLTKPELKRKIKRDLLTIVKRDEGTFFQKEFALAYHGNPVLAVAAEEVEGFETTRYEQAIARLDKRIPEDIKELINAQNLSTEDFLFLSSQRQHLQRNAKAFFWQTGILTQEFGPMIEQGYSLLKEQLSSNGLKVVHQRGNVLEIVDQESRDTGAIIKEMSQVLYLGED